jgi:hypothetical protein
VENHFFRLAVFFGGLKLKIRRMASSNGVELFSDSRFVVGLAFGMVDLTCCNRSEVKNFQSGFVNTKVSHISIRNVANGNQMHAARLTTC